MSTIAILREAHKGGGLQKSGRPSIRQISTRQHLLNSQEFNNNNKKINPNKYNENVFITFDQEKNEFITQKFYRNGKNSKLIEDLEHLENNVDKQAREDYKNHKLKERKENPGKKVRTVLQSKDLKREFVIALGGDKKITSQEDFNKKVLKTSRELMKAKGLEDKNLLSITIHYDEKTPHAHIQYNEYSFQHKTTATEFNKIRFKEGADAKEITKLNREKFAKLQDITAINMEMSRGERDSKAIHKEKYEFFREEVKNNPGINVVFNAQIKKVEAETQRNQAIKEKNQVNELLYDKSKEVNELSEKIEVLEKSKRFLELEKDKINNKSNELSELFKILGLESIKDYKTEDIKKVVEKPEFKTMLTNFLDMFKNLMKQLINSNIEKQIEDRKKVDFTRFKTNREQLTNNVDKVDNDNNNNNKTIFKRDKNIDISDNY